MWRWVYRFWKWFQSVRWIKTSLDCERKTYLPDLKIEELGAWLLIVATGSFLIYYGVIAY